MSNRYVLRCAGGIGGKNNMMMVSGQLLRRQRGRPPQGLGLDCTEHLAAAERVFSF